MYPQLAQFDFHGPAVAARLPLHGLLRSDGAPFWLLALLLFAILVSITVHEFGHAWMADRLGDPGPRAAGRVTLNPLAHLDLLGTLLMVVTLFIGFPVGWGKPVKTDPDLYRVDRKLGIGLVAAAGPAMNLLTAVALSPFARYILWGGKDTPLFQAVFLLIAVTMVVNLGLFVFNLLPLYPLDGSHITQSLLPAPFSDLYGKFMKRYGVFLFLGLMFTGTINAIVGPLVVRLFFLLLGLDPNMGR